MPTAPRKRSPNKSPEQVYSETIEQIARARDGRSYHLHLGKGRRSLRTIPPLLALPDLRTLDLSRTGATDLKPLVDLTRLERLILDDTSIVDISAISKLKSLKFLSITSGLLVDIAALAELEELETLLLTRTRVKDLDPLRNLSKLQRLEIDRCPVSDLSPLSNLTSLQMLDVDGTRISDLSPISGLRSLITLDCGNTSVSDLSPLTHLNGLLALNITRSKVVDLNPLQNLNRLHTLTAHRTGITNLNAVVNLQSLRRLNIDNTKVSSLEPISNLKLDRLDVDGCPISDLSPLAGHISMYRAAERQSFNGLWCTGCPLVDNELLELAKKENPQRTIEIISYLRTKEGLPPLVPNEVEPESPPDIPGQGPGPHFTLSYDGQINFAPPQALDRFGNNVERLESLKPLLADAAAVLLDGLSENEHPTLKKLVEQYAIAIEGEIDGIDFSRLYGLGLRLQNAAAAAERQINERLLPALEDSTREALESLTNLHGPFILSTKEGLELIEIAERYQRRPDAEREIREAALQLGKELLREPEIIEPDAAAFITQMAEEIDVGTQPERGTTYGLGTTRNVSIVLIAGATCGSLPVIGGLVAGAPGAIVGGIAALIGLEGLKKAKSFNNVSRGVTDTLDKVTDADLNKLLGQKVSSFAPHLQFVLAHEDLLRRLAGDRTQFRWLHSYLDWLKARKTP